MSIQVKVALAGLMLVVGAGMMLVGTVEGVVADYAILPWRWVMLSMVGSYGLGLAVQRVGRW